MNINVSSLKMKIGIFLKGDFDGKIPAIVDAKIQNRGCLPTTAPRLGQENNPGGRDHGGR
ncbi:hypothetical protein [Acidaminococcus timonensis]|uniref:hypothetical protein n=1 Tax=Acidaminococcus timonensis TaxID=1871002 RepID=UPI00307ACAED